MTDAQCSAVQQVGVEVFRVMVRVRVRGRGRGGVLPTTSHSIFCSKVGQTATFSH